MATVEVHPVCLKEDLAGLDDALRDAILDKIGVLAREPSFGKPLGHPLRGHHRLTYGRYRIVYRWDRDRDHVLVWYVGLRKEELYSAIEQRARRL